jgi:mutual gliding-motility protein MglA
MVRKDPQGRIHLKIVFYGCSMSGKTTSLRWLHEGVEGLEKGKFTSLADPTGRTLFFDYAPMQATSTVVFDVYTTAGQERHKRQRKVILKGVDGLIFVVDSSASALDDNIESITELRDQLGPRLGKEVPVVVTLNKRDVENAMRRNELVDKLELHGFPVFETVATNGFGVKKAFQSLARTVLLHQIAMKQVAL